MPSSRHHLLVITALAAMGAAGCNHGARIGALRVEVDALHEVIQIQRAQLASQQARLAALEAGAVATQSRLTASEDGQQSVAKAATDNHLLLDQLRSRLHASSGETERWRRHLAERIATLERRAGVVPPSSPMQAPTRGAAPPIEIELARAHLDAGEPAAARTSLAPLLASEKGPHLDEARYLVGASWAAEGRHGQAATAFHELLSTRPSAPWEERAMIGQAFALLAMNDVTTARLLLESVVRNYPDTDSAKKAAEALAKLDTRG